MSTSKEETRRELERIKEETSDIPPEELERAGGPEALRERMREIAESKQQITIRLDADIVTRFKELAGPDGSYQTLINRALREWLDARSVRRLLKEWFGGEAEARQSEKEEGVKS